MFIGVDLAWGQRARTGLAAVDDSGRLMSVTQRVSDDAIVTWFDDWHGEPVIAGFDAPIVVPNPTGSRPCEKLVGRYFGRYQASCHPANRSNPAFAHGSRAQHLADRLGLDVNPYASASRVALEVYPHTALVSVFELPRILRYKNKPGRDVALLRAEMMRLVAMLESLADAAVPLDVTTAPEWHQIRQAVDTATRKVDLSKVEDSLDSVVCAYVALLTARTPHAVRVLGNWRDGYIVTPVTQAMGQRIDSDLAAVR